MPKDLSSMTPAGLNSYLSAEFGVGLYPFALILHSIIREPIAKGRSRCGLDDGWNFPGWNHEERRFSTDEELLALEVEAGPLDSSEIAMNQAGLRSAESFKYDREDVRCLQKKVLNLRKKILGTTRELEECLHDAHYVGKEGEHRLAIAWGAAELLCKLQSAYEDMGSWSLTIGRPPSAKIEAACLWAELFRLDGLPAPWTLIADLLDWFLARLFPHELYREIFDNEEISDPEYFQQKYVKEKKRWELIFAYRRRQRLSEEFPGLPRRRWVMAFGQSWDGFGYVLHADSTEIVRNDFSKEVLEAARRILISHPESRLGVIFPDLTYFHIPDRSPKIG